MQWDRGMLPVAFSSGFCAVGPFSTRRAHSIQFARTCLKRTKPVAHIGIALHCRVYTKRGMGKYLLEHGASCRSGRCALREEMRLERHSRRSTHGVGLSTSRCALRQARPPKSHARTQGSLHGATMRYTFGDCELDTVHQTLYRAGHAVPLEGHVYAVLAYLLRHRHRVVPKDELLHSLWRKTPVYENTLQRCISQARRAIGCNPQTQPFIKTHYRKGYHFHATVTETSPVVLPPSVAPPWVSPPLEDSEGYSQQVTLLCCVIAARPHTVSRVQPDLIRHWCEQVMVAACAQITHQAGTVLYADETEVLALFSAPDAEAAHAQQALGAALALCTLGPAHPELQVQVGVHTAQITVLHPPGAPPPGWPLLGTMRALVTHLAQQAGPDTILLSAPTARQVRHLVQLRAVPGLPVSEGTSVLPVYQVHSASDTGSPAPVDAASPLVGRTQELALFHTLLARVTAGHGQVVGLLGEPGIGKTRLLAAFWRSLQDKAVTFIEGRCGAATTAPLRTLIGQLCGFHPKDPPGKVRETVRQTLQDVGLPPDAGGPRLLELLGGHSDLARSASPLDAASYQQALATLCQLLVNHSQQYPLIIVGEDLHWCDPLFEIFCTLLAEQVRDARVLLIGTARPGLAPAWLTQTAAALLTLAPLGLQDSTRVMQAIWGAAAVPAAIQHAIATKAAGNPLFLTEWTRAVVEADPAQQPLPMPDTIQDVLRTRIESLPRAARRLLQAAAVLGPTGPVPLLALLWEEPAAISPLLEVLVQRAVLTVHLDAGDPQYTFAHTLLQDVAYASLQPAQQQALHTRAAQALETHYANRLAVVCDALAAHAMQALALLDYAPARERDVRGLTLVLQLARAWSFLGRFAETRTLLEQHHATLERCQQPALAGRYYFRLGRTYSLLGEHTRAAATTRHALAAATQAQDAETMGLAHYELARERFLTGTSRDSLAHG